MYPSRFWVLNGLPGKPETIGKDYTFDLGHLDFAVEREAIYLHVPEMSPRDAEGRCLYPEQENWINGLVINEQIEAKQIWFSQWQFASLEAANIFEKTLWRSGAFREWHFKRASQKAGVLLESYQFTFFPVEEGSFRLVGTVDPAERVFLIEQENMIKKILKKNRLTATPKGVNQWSLKTVEALKIIEIELKKLGAVYRGESYYY